MRIIDTAVVEVRADFPGEEIEQELGVEPPDLLPEFFGEIQLDLAVIAARSASVNLMSVMGLSLCERPARRPICL
ncbi:hypothetical protein FHR53_000874 [Xanthomonas arboricola]